MQIGQYRVRHCQWISNLLYNNNNNNYYFVF